MKLNRRFDRHESEFNHYYKMIDFGSEPKGNQRYSGYLKCKLMHTQFDGMMMSVIVPDLIFLEGKPLKWIQPLGFLPNMLVVDGETGYVRNMLPVDISSGHTLRIEFDNVGFVKQLSDGSDIFKCTITGPAALGTYATGQGHFDEHGTPYIELFHHTSDDARTKILEGQWLKDSPWNIQGTQKLENVGYAYLACLDALTTEGDLGQIGMSCKGDLMFRTDNTNELLVLPVYRRSTEDLKATLKFDVDASVLAPQHLYRHAPRGGGVWYEVCTPFIYRIGTESGKGVSFTQMRIENHEEVRRFDYIVLGDCRTVQGLAAPFDEENTKYIFKVEKPAGGNILNFWRDNPNKDHYTGKQIEFQKFSNPKKDLVVEESPKHHSSY